MATISKNLGVLPSLNPNVTAQKSKEDSWVLVLKSTERENQGQVTCDVQHVEIQTTFLFVQGVCTCVRKLVSVADFTVSGPQANHNMAPSAAIVLVI